jgi:cation:H+ antiporter
LLLGLVLLIIGGDLLVRGAVSFANIFRVPSFLIGVTVVSFGTSAPELMVSIQAALDNVADIAIGNVMGSNIANIALVLGISVIIKPINVNPNTYRLSWWIMLFSSLLYVVFILDGVLSLTEGLMFLLGLVSFIFLSIRYISYSGDTPTETQNNSFWLAILFFALGSVGLYFGSELFVKHSVLIASYFGVSEFVIGVTVVALGTSLPELVTSMVALFRGQNNISIGNLMGSNIFNVFAVLGVTTLFQELKLKLTLLYFDFGVMIGVVLLFGLFIFIRKKISRIGGVLLLFGYLAYIFITVT